jgi:hypothetical protein
MTDAIGRSSSSAPPRGRWIRFRLTTLLVLVAACAVGLAMYAQYRRSTTPWQQAGGMIGWSQVAIESRLGPPDESFPVELPDTHGRRIRPAPPGPHRTLIYRALDGTFVVWLSEANGKSECFRSKWAEYGSYY